MIMERYGRDCMICARPFTAFRWCPDMRMRFKKTEICQMCARLKNVCQTCVLDLGHGLPTQVRDAAAMDQSAMGAVGNETLAKLSRMAPYYMRNRPRICSFWLRGVCKRGDECSYRHEKPCEPDDPLYRQDIRDRYYGHNDPVAEKMLRRVGLVSKLEVPMDKTISTLFVGNLTEQITATELLRAFYPYGKVRSVTLVPRQSYAFVQFVSRSDAELAAERTHCKLILKGRKLIINWARTQGKPFNPNSHRRYGGGAAVYDKGGSHTQPSELPRNLIPTKVYKQFPANK